MTLNNHKQTVSHLTFTALMAAAMCILGPMSVPIGAIPISLDQPGDLPGCLGAGAPAGSCQRGRVSDAGGSGTAGVFGVCRRPGQTAGPPPAAT